jgi:glycosyltransferase involved in cell wall biosynthesis
LKTEDDNHLAAERRRILIIDGPDVKSRVELTRRLASQYEVVVAGTDPKATAAYQELGVQYHQYTLNRGSNPLSDVRTFISLRRLIGKVNPDLVQTFSTKPGVWGRLASRQAGVKMICGTITGLGGLYSGHGLRRSGLRFIYERLQRTACRSSSKVVFQNQRDLEEFVSRGVVDEQKSVVIPGSGVDSSRFTPRVGGHDRSRIRQDLGLSPDAVVFTMISRLVRSKGVLDFCNAAVTARSRNPNYEFLLVGDVDYENVDGLTNSELGFARKAVTWLGRRADIPDILQATDVFVFPTAYREGVPRVVLEAAATGLPIITTIEGSGGIAVRDGENGIVVPHEDVEALSDALNEIGESEQKRSDFGAESRRKVLSMLDIDTISERYRDIYVELIGDSDSPS